MFHVEFRVPVSFIDSKFAPVHSMSKFSSESHENTAILFSSKILAYIIPTDEEVMIIIKAVNEY